MSLVITPSGSLIFDRPLTHPTQKILVFSNPNDEPILFKVMTTSPSKYCVRPNSGRINPGEQVEVVFLKQAVEQGKTRASGSIGKDRFLVKSVQVDASELDSKSTTGIDLSPTMRWDLMEKSRDYKIHEQKFRCVYLDSLGDERQLGWSWSRWLSSCLGGAGGGEGRRVKGD